jgi:hypothetical protein
MYIKKNSNKLVDIFIDVDGYTGWEPANWLRLALKNGKWVQLAGIRVQPWEFRKIVGELDANKI